VIFRRFCCCFCRKKPNQYENDRHQRDYSGSLTTETSQIPSRPTKSFTREGSRTKAKQINDLDSSTDLPFREPTTSGPVVSFTDFLAQTGDDDLSSHDDKESNEEFISKKNPTLTADS
jgi:hypothetical protein